MKILINLRDWPQFPLLSSSQSKLAKIVTYKKVLKINPIVIIKNGKSSINRLFKKT